MAVSELRTLGGFALTVDGRTLASPSTQKARALVAFLALRNGERVARERIVEVFWPDADPERARQSLKTALWSIRRILRDAGEVPEAYVAADAATASWVAPTLVDAAEFLRLCAAGDPSAVDRYAGEFLPGDYDEWTSTERERLSRELERLLGTLLERAPDVRAAQQLLQLDPFSEAAYRTLITVELEAGRTVVAQTLAQRFQSVLEENGLAFSPAFAQLVAELGTRDREMLPLRFIGRSRELVLFDGYLRDASAGPMIVHAPAGLGKTELRKEFARRALEQGRRVIQLAIRDDVRAFGGWERVYEEETTTAFDALLRERGASIAVALADGIVSALPRGSSVFVDDAHRLAGDAAHVTERITAVARDRGLGIVFFTRPEGVADVLRLCGGEAGSEVALESLRLEEIRAAIPERGSEADALATTLFERTQGHPLFLGRLVEALRSGEAPRALRSVKLEMPESVRALLAQRLRERGDEPYLVAALLALDRDFSSDELARILEWKEERVLDALDDLLALGIVRDAQRSPYLDFTHDVVAEVARESIGAQRRRRLHRLAAEALKDAASILDLVRRADHRAQSAEVLEAARDFKRAGELSMRAFQPRNAYELFVRAGALVDERSSGDALRLGLEIASRRINALNYTSEARRAREEAAPAIARAEVAGEESLLLELLLLDLSAALRLNDLEALERVAGRVQAVALALRNDAATARACHGFSYLHRARGEQEAARAWGRQAIDDAMRGGDLEYAFGLLGELAFLELLFWNFDGAFDLIHEAEALAGRVSPVSLTHFRYNHCQAMYLLDRFDESASDARWVLASLDAAEFGPADVWTDRQRMRFLANNMLALIATARGAWDDAWECTQAALESTIARESATNRAHAVEIGVRSLLGRRAEGDVALAASLLERIAPADNVTADARLFLACARAAVAAASNDPTAREQIRLTLEMALVECAKQPIEADRVFATLRDAAREIGEKSLADEAHSAFETYYERRRTAAGTLWGQ